MATANLLDASQSFMTPDNLNKLSAALGQSSEKVQSGLKSVIPAFIMGLVNKGSTTEGAQSLVNLVKQKGFDSEVPPPNINDENYLRSGNEAVNGVLGNNLNSVVNGLTTSTGMSSSSVKKMLGMVAPMVLGVLGTKIRSENLNASGVMGFLNQQKSAVVGFMPAGLTSIFGGTRTATETTVKPTVKPTVKTASTAKYTIDEGTRRPSHASSTSGPTSTRSDYRKSDYGYVGGNRRSRLWGVLGLLAVLALGIIMWMFSKNRAINVPEVSVPTATQHRAEQIQGKLAQTPADMDSGVLPGMVAPAASLSELADFVEFGSTFDLPRRFRFDYLTFNTGTTNLSAQASKELDMIAAALKSKSSVRGRVEGFTDNVGNPEANVQLSTERAAAVKDLLVSRGIAADRIEVIGRGSATPISENNSEAGKALNRRIEFVVTKLQ